MRKLADLTITEYELEPYQPNREPETHVFMRLEQGKWIIKNGGGCVFSGYGWLFPLMRHEHIKQTRWDTPALALKYWEENKDYDYEIDG